ncbi:TRAM domain-containing protein, partial [Lysobacter sp. 2RAB21]
TASKDPNELTGKTENMRSVNFPAPQRLIGQFVDVMITEAMPNSLRGRVHLGDSQAAAGPAAHDRNPRMDRDFHIREIGPEEFERVWP